MEKQVVVSRLRGAAAQIALALCALYAPDGLSRQGDALGVELVEVRLQALQEAGTGSDSETVQAYSKARSWLKQAATYDRDAEAYSRAMVEAPKQEAEIQARIDASPADNAARASRRTPVESELRALLARLRGELLDATAGLDDLSRHLQAREANADEIRNRLRSIEQRAGELPETGTVIDAPAAPSLPEAGRWQVEAERQALRAERQALQARLASQPARYRLYRVQRTALSQQIDRLNERIRALEKQLSKIELAALKPESIGIAPADPAYPIASELAEESVALWHQRVTLDRRVQQTQQQRDEVERLAKVLAERMATARRLVDFASDSDALGAALLIHWREIDRYRIKDDSEQRLQTIGDNVIGRIRGEERLAELASSTSYVNSQLEAQNLDPDGLSERARSALNDAIRTLRDHLTRVIAMQSEYIETLSVLNADYQSLDELARNYRAYIGGLILWKPSHSRLVPAAWQELPVEAKAVSAGASAAVDSLSRGDVPATTLLALLAGCMILPRRRALRASRRALNQRIARPREDKIGHTLSALALSLLCALPWPLFLLGLEQLLVQASSPISELVARPLWDLVLLVLAACLLRELCAEDGVGPVHFKWPVAACERIARDIALIQRWIIPLGGLAALVLALQREQENAVLGRLLYLLPLLLLALGQIYLLRQQRPFTREIHRQRETQLRAGLLLLCLGLMVSILLGHVYSANLVIDRLIASAWLILVLSLCRGLLIRSLNATRRRLRLQQLLASRSEDEEHYLEENNFAALGEISAASLQLIKTGTKLLGLVALIYLWAPLLPALDLLGEATLWSTTQLVDGESVNTAITLRTLVFVSFLALVTLFAGRRLPALVELILRSRTQMSASARYTTSTLLNYLIVGGGLIAILSALGLQWSQLQWLVAALGVGIGFGLQEIIANFISGLIILFERPIRVGDIVTVGASEGTVNRIRIRATTITDWDGKELLVPNKEFITGRLLNWTLSDPKTRVVINVGVAYDSDVECALARLRDIVCAHPAVLDDPRPSIVLREFGANAVELTARCFVAEVDERWNTINALHRAIFRRFKEAGIEIAFPQCDVHLDIDERIRVAVDSGQESDRLSRSAATGLPEPGL